MARKPKQERAKATVDAIIEAGFISVKVNGLENATTKNIADIAGVSIGSVYEYFDDKEAIYRAMVQSFVDHNIAMLKQETPNIIKLPIGEAVSRLLYRYRDILKANDDQYLQILRFQGRFEIEMYVKQAEAVLMEIIMKYAMHNPKYLKVPNLMITCYVLINAAVFSVIRYLDQPTSQINFDELISVIISVIENHLNAVLIDEKS